eukprot:243956_1
MSKIAYDCLSDPFRGDCWKKQKIEQYDCSEWTKKKLDEGEAKFREVMAGGLAKGYKHAASNMKHFLGKTGRTVSFSKSFLLKSQRLKDRKTKNMKRIICGIYKRGTKLKVGKKMKEQICWCSSVNADKKNNPDLYYSSGGFIMGTQSDITITRISSDEIQYSMPVVEQVFHDVYNWDPTKSVKIPFFGHTPDTIGYCLEKAGRGKSFKIRTKWIEATKSGTLHVGGDECGLIKPVKRTRQDVFAIWMTTELLFGLFFFGCVAMFSLVCGGVFGYIGGHYISYKSKQ